VQISISDNGSGHSQKDEWEKEDSLGINLIRVLIEQLKGKMEIKTNGGTVVSLIFPVDFSGEPVFKPA